MKWNNCTNPIAAVMLALGLLGCPSPEPAANSKPASTAPPVASPDAKPTPQPDAKPTPATGPAVDGDADARAEAVFTLMASGAAPGSLPVEANDPGVEWNPRLVDEMAPGLF